MNRLRLFPCIPTKSSSFPVVKREPAGIGSVVALIRCRDGHFLLYKPVKCMVLILCYIPRLDLSIEPCIYLRVPSASFRSLVDCGSLWCCESQSFTIDGCATHSLPLIARF